ncbi:hypothetical protein CU098_003630 [Rhizopus stolonifer]|uniref:Uncharacterized protein n=1 Tax=Rhizopus stolonifer TaxID=4846 RepID=A0A367IX22_RHIST|nr:hypothetical protein CU098_003630 [Rhizopus stolonifer]
MYTIKQDKPNLTIRLKLNTIHKKNSYYHDTVKKESKKRHRKSRMFILNRLRKQGKSSLTIDKQAKDTPLSTGRSFYWTSERIETTKFILRTVMTN